ncbi:hypothetical protein [uncultured Methanoregula sp.]|uniref:hypothetical protein n=1 Tax=uncultured Methanoregula sp. TaxID=1005933 RepID=UPI002AAB3488|nr:hypothetical protein [uncultured Methanoregula sp.]
MKFILVILAIGFVLASGCTQAPAPQVQQAAPSVTPTAIATTTTIAAQLIPTFPTPKYKIGDVISREMPYYNQGFMIAGYNESSGKYRRMELNRWIYSNGSYGPWYKAPGNNWDDMNAYFMEQNYPVYLGHVNPNETPGVSNNRVYKSLEIKADEVREQWQCELGIGTLDYCLKIADKYGISRDSMKKSFCSESNAC